MLSSEDFEAAQSFVQVGKMCRQIGHDWNKKSYQLETTFFFMEK